MGLEPVEDTAVLSRDLWRSFGDLAESVEDTAVLRHDLWRSVGI